MTYPSAAKPLSRAEQMRSGAVLPLLLRMASPNALAFLVQAGVSMVEVWYIGRLGTLALAAIALVFPGLMLMQMLAGGALGGAVTSAVARAIGGHQTERAERLIWHALVIALTGGAVFFLLFALFGRAILVSLGAHGAVLDQALAYGGILFAGGVFIWINALLSSVFRGMGDMRFPALLMMGSAVLQVPLGGALILGWFSLPRFGVAGAAMSAVTIAALSSIALLVRLSRGKVAAPLRLSRRGLQFELFADIFRVGALASLAPVLTVLTIAMVNGLISGFGPAAIAGYGISARLEFLLIPLVFGFGVAMTSLVGVSIGAGNVARAEHIGWVGGSCAAALAGVIGAVLALFPALWVNLFTDDPAAAAAGASYLHIAGPAFAFQGLGLSLYFASQGARAMAWPVIATVLRFAVAVGGAIAGVRWFGFGQDFVFACIAFGMFLYGAITAAALRLGAWRPRTVS